MDKDTKQPVQDIDILDVLLDEDNEDPITLYDENSKAIRERIEQNLNRENY